MTKINIRDYLHFPEEDGFCNELRISQDERDEMLEAFTLYDKDRDGLICTKELGSVIRSLGQVLTVCEETDIVAQFAQEKCYEINFIAFYKLMELRRKKYDEDNELRESFRKFDKEDKSYVNVEELKTMLLTIGEPLTEEEVDNWLKDGEEFTKAFDMTYNLTSKNKAVLAEICMLNMRLCISISECKILLERKEIIRNSWMEFNDETDNSEPLEDQEKNPEETEQYEFTEEEKESLCRAFTLLDVDGDGVIYPPDLEKLLISWGRMPMDEELDDIMSYVNGKGCEGETGMDFKGFRSYLAKQLANTNDEEELREAFQVFDSIPPTGKLSLTELRHYLKHQGLKITDDEIDFLFKEEDYWMLAEKNIFEYEHLIDKILNKPTCNSPFLNCGGPTENN